MVAINVAFETKRLDVAPLLPYSQTASFATLWDSALGAILAPKVLALLPPSLQRDNETSVSEWLSRQQAEGSVLGVTRKGQTFPVGLMLLHETCDSSGIVEIYVGYLLSEDHWGQGYATELLNGFAASVSGRAGRIIGGVDPRNIASKRVLENAGFCKSETPMQSGVEHYVLECQT